MATIYDRVSAMSGEQRDAITQKFDSSSRVVAAEPIAGASLSGGCGRVEEGRSADTQQEFFGGLLSRIHSPRLPTAEGRALRKKCAFRSLHSAR